MKAFLLTLSTILLSTSVYAGNLNRAQEAAVVQFFGQNLSGLNYDAVGIVGSEQVLRDAGVVEDSNSNSIDIAKSFTEQMLAQPQNVRCRLRRPVPDVRVADCEYSRRFETDSQQQRLTLSFEVILDSNNAPVQLVGPSASVRFYTSPIAE